MSEEGFHSLGDFLLREIRAKDTVKYPTLTELLTKLQVYNRLRPEKSAAKQLLALLLSVISSHTSLSVQEALPNRDTGDQIASLLMEQLGGLQYPDDLITFTSDMSQLMHSHASALDVDAVKGGADVSSAMSFYIRHCCVSFHMLAFEVRSPFFTHAQSSFTAVILVL